MSSKRNWTLRAAVLMLALVLVSSCFVGGTFAKYTTAGSGSDSARVAKFGVKVEAEGNVFAKEYDTKDADVEDYEGQIIAKSVVSSGAAEDDKVVAPGTSKADALTVAISGTPEVAVEVKYVATVALNDKWVDADGAYYCPLKITVDGTTVYGMDYASADKFAEAIKAAIDGKTKNYQANTNLATVNSGANGLNVSWAWDFEGTDGKQTDVKDTFLGDQAAAGNAATVSITVGATVTQID